MAKTESKLKAKHILVAGSDEFSVKERGQSLLRELAPEDPMNLETIDGQVDSVDQACRQLDSLVESLLTLPFLADSKLVFFKNCNFLADSVTANSEAVISRLLRLTELIGKLPPSSVQLVMTAVSIDRRKAFYKSFEKLGMVELFNLPEIQGARAEEAWMGEIEKLMIQAGLKPGPGVVERMFEVVGNDRRALHSEVEKLSLFAHPHGDISEEDLKQVVSGNRELMVWDLLDAVIAGDSAESVHMLRQLLAQNESEVGILILLAGQVRLAALGTHLLETRRLRLSRSGTFLNADLTQEGIDFLPVNKKGEKPKPFRIARIVEQARRKPPQKWFEALDVLYQTNLRMVSSATDPEKLLETAILRICQI
ncbi:MAG: DNA polymerase III subunit delta [Methylacidiphilales bacterium]|nr:DNA polymerase III subunit delta [Candidatus Methylacidiphilales bacterium]